MLERFYPTECAASVYEVNFTAYYEKGIRGIIFDIDNTLVPHGKPADKRAVELFSKLHSMGFQTCLISNNRESRVKPFAAAVDSMYICNAHKPSAANYRKAVERMGVSEGTALFIGDQIFTDIYGANRAGIASLLVDPIHPKEEIQIVLKRYLEKIVLHFFEKNVREKRSNGPSEEGRGKRR
ncbi:MAG: YqeG family HAD IIIA-type phosphatase [Lachnospiraceae bacterium]|nr:YqeG family HAD IIIA-type phosphatase [Candidatus Fimimorpha excrementavium]